MCLHYSLVRLYSRHSHEALAAVDHCAGMIDVEAPALIKRVAAFLNSRLFLEASGSDVLPVSIFSTGVLPSPRGKFRPTVLTLWSPGRPKLGPQGAGDIGQDRIQWQSLQVYVRGHPGSIHMDKFSKKNAGGESVLEYATCEMDESGLLERGSAYVLVLVSSLRLQ